MRQRPSWVCKFRQTREPGGQHLPGIHHTCLPSAGVTDLSQGAAGVRDDHHRGQCPSGSSGDLLHNASLSTSCRCRPSSLLGQRQRYLLPLVPTALGRLLQGWRYGPKRVGLGDPTIWKENRASPGKEKCESRKSWWYLLGVSGDMPAFLSKMFDTLRST